MRAFYPALCSLYTVLCSLYPALCSLYPAGTGNHYVVRLNDQKNTCTCLDHRFRRHDCKHIRLIHEQMGIADAPQQWREVGLWVLSARCNGSMRTGCKLSLGRQLACGLVSGRMHLRLRAQSQNKPIPILPQTLHLHLYQGVSRMSAALQQAEESDVAMVRELNERRALTAQRAAAKKARKHGDGGDAAAEAEGMEAATAEAAVAVPAAAAAAAGGRGRGRGRAGRGAGAGGGRGERQLTEDQRMALAFM